MKVISFLVVALVFFSSSYAQELYPYSEPASNNPAQSVSVKAAAILHGDVHGDKTIQRYMPEVALGLSKKWMVKASANFSNMQQENLRWDGGRVYAKYRFLSNDEVHKHFRMAVFGAGTYSRNYLNHNEVNLGMGDQSGVQAGLIATQLWHKLAISGTVGWNEVLNEKRKDKSLQGIYAFQALNYSLSAGYLLLPVEYKDYDQTNLNLYVELLGGRNFNLPGETHFVDLAPSLQAIFSSTAKLNVGYRFQLSSDIYRMTKNSVMVSFEYLFLNALKRRAN
ncbi:hypothetical protein HRG84_15265 [Flavisolibacter sp. BT320]|nr:hypothetical protein [Flavisolibacter longurius]